MKTQDIKEKKTDNVIIEDDSDMSIYQQEVIRLLSIIAKK